MSSAQKEMKGLMKKNKELDLNFIDKLQDEMFDMNVGTCPSPAPPSLALAPASG